MNTGPKIDTDALLFGYDTGYPLITTSNDSYKFNLGEPTTNKLNNNILGQGNGASLDSDDFGTYIQLADITSSYSRFQLPSITVVSNEVYTWSFELYSTETITQSGNKYYFDTNEYSDQFPTSNDLSRVGFTNIRPSSIPANEWTKFSLTVTMKANLTGAYTYDFFNMVYPHFQNKKIYYRNMQFETKPHNTPYAGQGNTRSVENSLIDLKRNTTINISDVSFDTDAQMFFDGTDDHITINNPGISNDRFTIEMVLKPDSYPNSPMLINPNSTGIDQYIRIWSNGQIGGVFVAAADTTGDTCKSTTQLSTAEYTHFVISKTQSAIKVYINGELETTVTPTVSAAPWTGNWDIGQRANNTFNYDGELPILKVYKNEMSASTVKSNFKGLRSRFNI